MFSNRFAAALLVATLAAPVAAFAQAGVPAAAPSNSEGIPSTSVGNVGTTRVGPARTVSTRRHVVHHRARRPVIRH